MAAILAFYTLALAFLPCADDIAYQDHSTDEIAMEQSHPDCQGHDEEGARNCSPLCVCHCCHTHVSFPNVEVAVIEQHFNNEYSSFYTSFLSTSHLNSLFRPPRV